MHITHLSLTNFRNYARLELDLPPGPVVLVGANAQGKTNLLEAIYYLATSRSPYTNTDRQLINWLADDNVLPYARLVADVVNANGAATRIEITLQKLANGINGERLQKVIRVDGLDRRAMDLLGRVNVVFFVPQDLALVEGSPVERRRYLNVTLCQTDPTYCRALGDYDKLIAQRNALLRRIRDGLASPGELAYWDEQVAQKGAVLVTGRQKLLRDLEGEAQRIHRELTGGMEYLELRYLPSFTPTAEANGQLSFSAKGLDIHRQLDAGAVAPQFLEALQSRRRHEIERGMTTLGPHRDEMRFEVNGHDLGDYGSRGQARTAVMALKLSELAWMRSTVGEWPVLLLDEVVAELDAQRRAYLLAAVEEAQQAVLATTEAELFTPDFLARAARWRVAAGQITAEDGS
ncbi:MAG: DNA replication/repair protein RecF [Anaerolineae bacterium]|nr:DNA replication/repair protein RecF [Anaerolineae bacterium]